MAYTQSKLFITILSNAARLFVFLYIFCLVFLYVTDHIFSISAVYFIKSYTWHTAHIFWSLQLIAIVIYNLRVGIMSRDIKIYTLLNILWLPVEVFLLIVHYSRVNGFPAFAG